MRWAFDSLPPGVRRALNGLPPGVRRVLKIGLPTLGLLLIALIVGFGPLVRSRAAAEAQRRGMTVQIGEVRPGWGHVWLRNVRIVIPQVPALEIALTAVDVDLTAAGSVEAVRAHGGTLSVNGSPADLERQVQAWRDTAGAQGTAGGRRRSVVAEGLRVVWHGIGPVAQELWGVRYERAVDGQETISADLARVTHRGFSFDLERASLALRSSERGRVLEKLAAEGAFATITLDNDLSAGLFGARGAGNPAAAAPKTSEQSAWPAKAVEGKPAKTLEGKPARTLERKAGSVAPDAAERGPKLRAAFARIAAALETSLPAGSELDLSSVRMKIRRGNETLNVGPGRLHTQRTPDRVSVAFVPATGASSPLALRVEVPFRGGPVAVELDGGPVSLAALGVKEKDFGLFDVGKAELEARGRATLAADGRRLAFDGSGKLRGLSLDSGSLSSQPVRGIKLGWRGKGEIALDGTRVRVDDGELEVGSVRIHAKGELERGPEHTRAWFQGGVPLASCQAMLDSLPGGLAPLLSGLRMQGTFSLAGKLEVDTAKLDAMRFDFDLANECRVTETPVEIAARRFKSSWVREVNAGDGRLEQIQSGPGTPAWVPFHSISAHMETAVLICEDGAFRRHHGFDGEAIRNSLRENIRAGRFLRGASTISMQLAKNLYLSREKTLSRKLQEAVFTLLLEQELSKDEILELYLNVVEFGPGIYGIGPAAQHYFNASASQLSLGQSLYLASILPNPKKGFFGADGQVTPGWAGYLRKLMRIALKIHRITEEDLEDALREQVTFKVPYSPRSPAEGEASAEPGSEDGARLDSPLEETSFSSP